MTDPIADLLRLHAPVEWMPSAAPGFLFCAIDHEPWGDSGCTVIRALAELDARPALDVVHPYTCGVCPWGRNPENHSLVDFCGHMEGVHPGLPRSEWDGPRRPALDEARLARLLDDLFPATQQRQWPFTVQQAAAAIAKAYAEDAG